MILDSSLFWSSERSFSTDKYAFRKYWSKKEEGQNREERKNREGGEKHFSQEGEKKEKKGGVIGRMGIFGLKNRRRSEKENILEKENVTPVTTEDGLSLGKWDIKSSILLGQNPKPCSISISKFEENC